MSSDKQKILSAAVIKLLRPLVHVLLRHGMSYGAFADLAKWVYIDVAAGKKFSLKGRKQTNSRVSTLTGLSRKEVLRVKRLPHPQEQEADERYNRAARVVSGWTRDPRFANDEGDPAELAIEGASLSFQALVKAHSGDVPYRAILDELQRVGAVRLHDGERVELVTRAYVPQTDTLEKMTILGTDVALLLETIDHNLQSEGGKQLRFQRKVAYNNLPQEVLPKFRHLSADKAQALLEEMDVWLAQHDRDSNPQSQGTGKKQAGIGIYYFEQDAETGDEGEA